MSYFKIFQKEYEEHMNGKFFLSMMIILIGVGTIGFGVGFILGYSWAFKDMIEVAQEVLNNPDLMKLFLGSA